MVPQAARAVGRPETGHSNHQTVTFHWVFVHSFFLLFFILVFISGPLALASVSSAAVSSSFYFDARPPFSLAFTFHRLPNMNDSKCAILLLFFIASERTSRTHTPATFYSAFGLQCSATM